MTSEKPPRRWFRPRFSLTTLFVVVTVFACWLGYSLNWIKQRRAFVTSKYAVDMSDLTKSVRPTAPRGLWLFGEEGAAGIFISPDKYEEMSDEGRSLFPEAEVYTLPIDTWAVPL